MKYIAGFFRIIFSLLLTVLLTVSLLAFGVVKPISDQVTYEGLSKTVNNVVNDVVDMMINDEETQKQVTDVLEENLSDLGIQVTTEDLTSILQQEDVKEMVSDFVSSVALHAIDGETEVVYPKEEQLSDVIENNFDLVVKIVGEDQVIENPTSEQIDQFVSEYYDVIISQLEGLVGNIEGAINGSN